MENTPESESTYKDLNNFVLYLPGSDQREQMKEMGLLETRIGDVETECSPKKSALTYGQWLQEIDRTIDESGIGRQAVQTAVKAYLGTRTEASFKELAELIQPVIDRLEAAGYSEFDIKS